MRRYGWLGLAVCAGCADWPLHSHLPEAEPAISTGVELAELVEVEWIERGASEPDADPTALVSTEIGVGQGLLAAGTLEGLGWSDAASSPVIESEECGSSGNLGPGEGYYTYDIDLLLVEPGEGVLCARALFDAPDLGWDLLIHPVDSCGVPSGPVLAGDRVLGMDLGGQTAGWSAPLAPGRYALSLAGYDPLDKERMPAYQLGVALIPEVPGESPICPMLPAEHP